MQEGNLWMNIGKSLNKAWVTVCGTSSPVNTMVEMLLVILNGICREVKSCSCWVLTSSATECWNLPLYFGLGFLIVYFVFFIFIILLYNIRIELGHYPALASPFRYCSQQLVSCNCRMWRGLAVNFWNLSFILSTAWGFVLLLTCMHAQISWARPTHMQASSHCWSAHWCVSVWVGSEEPEFYPGYCRHVSPDENCIWSECLQEKENVLAGAQLYLSWIGQHLHRLF